MSFPVQGKLLGSDDREEFRILFHGPERSPPPPPRGQMLWQSRRPSGLFESTSVNPPTEPTDACRPRCKLEKTPPEPLGVAPSRTIQARGQRPGALDILPARHRPRHQTSTPWSPGSSTSRPWVSAKTFRGRLAHAELAPRFRRIMQFSARAVVHQRPANPVRESARGFRRSQRGKNRVRLHLGFKLRPVNAER